MSKISMLIPDEQLALIDEVAEPNRTAFMIDAALEAARRIKRAREDAAIACICAESGRRDRELAGEFTPTLGEGL